MLLGSAKSVNTVNIRLTKERWRHITQAHPEILLTDYESILNIISDPDAVLEGSQDELLAAKKRRRYWYVVIYKEVNQKDGFVITAYITTDATWLFRRKLLWSKES